MIRDSLNASKQHLLELQKQRQAKDSVQVVANTQARAADSLRRASALNLDAKRAAENSEAFQRNITQSRTVQLETYKDKAHRRGFVVALLVALDLVGGCLLITH